MKKWIFLSIACSLFALSLPSFAKTGNPDYRDAQKVLVHWFTAMKNNQTQEASNMLAPQFTSIHTDGIVRNKAQEIELIKNLHMKDFHLTQFQFAQSGNTIIATYKDAGSEQIDHQAINTKSAGRMAVLQKQNKKLMILAYANLDQIG